MSLSDLPEQIVAIEVPLEPQVLCNKYKLFGRIRKNLLTGEELRGKLFGRIRGENSK